MFGSGACAARVVKKASAPAAMLCIYIYIIRSPLGNPHNFANLYILKVNIMPSFRGLADAGEEGSNVAHG